MRFALFGILLAGVSAALVGMSVNEGQGREKRRCAPRVTPEVSLPSPCCHEDAIPCQNNPPRKLLDGVGTYYPVNNQSYSTNLLAYGCAPTKDDNPNVYALLCDSNTSLVYPGESIMASGWGFSWSGLGVPATSYIFFAETSDGVYESDYISVSLADTETNNGVDPMCTYELAKPKAAPANENNKNAPNTKVEILYPRPGDSVPSNQTIKANGTVTQDKVMGWLVDDSRKPPKLYPAKKTTYTPPPQEGQPLAWQMEFASQAPTANKHRLKLRVRTVPSKKGKAESAFIVAKKK